MNLFRASLAAAAALVAAAGSAGATVYDFSVDLTNGVHQGTVTGRVNLPFVSGLGSGTGAASNLTLTTVTTGILLPEGKVATGWANQFRNTFTVTDGVVTAFQFDAFTAFIPPSPVTAGNEAAATDLCMNTGTVFATGDFFCPAGGVYFGTNNLAGDFGIAQASDAVFTPVPVPEPGAWDLLILGFAALGALLRRRGPIPA